MKSNPRKLRQWHPFVVLLVVLFLSSCGSKTEHGAAPSTSPASPAANTATGSGTSASGSSATPSAASPRSEATLSDAAKRLGVTPTNATTCPSTAPVKGKVTTKRGDIYHIPNSPGYEQVKPTICFTDRATAERAGFRAPKAQEQG